MEDDIEIRDAPFLKRLCCFLTRFLKTSADTGSTSAMETQSIVGNLSHKWRGYDLIHFHFGPGPIGVGADVYLTSFEGAVSQLRRYCRTGIFNGFDFMTNHQHTGETRSLHVARATTNAVMRRKNAPTGKGSAVRVMSHYPTSQLVEWTNESAHWPLSRCMRWVQRQT